MRFFFDERKAAQAAAFLLGRHGGAINYMVLIKLLYLADRKALIETGQPITGDRMVSMPHGPVLSGILDLINMGNPSQGRAWFEYVAEPENYTVRLVQRPADFDELSEYELAILSEIDDKFGSMNKWLLRDLTHTLPEWQDLKGSSDTIQPEDILRCEGKSPEEIERVASEAMEICFFRTLQSGVPVP